MNSMDPHWLHPLRAGVFRYIKQQWYRRHGLIVFAGVLAALWLVLASMVVTKQGDQYGSPDERANDFFITRLAHVGTLSFRPGLSVEALSTFHPRSMFVHGETLSPGSFVGFIQLSALVDRIFGGWPIHRYLTPVLGLLALVSLYGIFRHFWERSWSLLGVALIAAHPAVFAYWTAPFMQNGAFTALLVLAGYYLLRHHQEPSWKKLVIFAIVYGLAICVRPIEIIWTGPMVLVVLCAMPRGYRWVALAVPVALALQTPWLIADAGVYGSPLTSAYTPEGVFTSAAGTQTFLTPIFRVLTPAGGQWSWHWLSSFWWYLVMLVPAWSVAAAVSLFLYFRRKFVQPVKILKIGLIILLTSFLGSYYGSWDLYPGANAAQVGAFSSYARYWLPIFVAMGAGVIVLLRRVRPIHPALMVMLIVVMLTSQSMAIWSHPVSGLSSRAHQAQTFRTKLAAVEVLVPTDGLILAGHYDKVFWPQRLTSFSYASTPSALSVLSQVAAERSVFMYVTPHQFGLKTVNDSLSSVGLKIGHIWKIQGDQLWEVTKK